MGTEYFYPGSDYGLDPNFGLDTGYGGFTGYRLKAGNIGFPTDPFTANQLKAVSDKLSSGTKHIELTAVHLGGGDPMKLLETIPKQHFKEINRLKKLTGAELSMHGPLVEASGVNNDRFDEATRQEAELGVWRTMERGHELDPKGNVMITFHSSNGLPEPVKTIVEVDPQTGKPKEKIVQFLYIDETQGKVGGLGELKPDYFEGKKFTNHKEFLEERNKEQWTGTIADINRQAVQGRGIVDEALKINKVQAFKEFLDKNPIELAYEEYKAGGKEKLKTDAGPELYPVLEHTFERMNYADAYLKDAYNTMKNLFNTAYETAVKKGDDEQKKKLDVFLEENSSTIKDIQQHPARLGELGQVIANGLEVIKEVVPQRFAPLREFALDKASDTFGNVALKSYKEFRDTSPIISIENPPTTLGLTRAEDLKDLVKMSRAKFAEKAMSELGMSEKEARKKAEMLIGVTWDVGHINQLRKYGYSDKDILKETEKIAPYVKHTHLSDNFGLSNVELPMGMGNVPTKGHFEIISNALGKKIEKLKAISETGDWHSTSPGALGMGKITPTRETLMGMGSPIYSMKMAPYWNQTPISGYYFGGIGATNPDVHHQYFGSGFTNLPLEFGGQMGGKNRLSGAPMEG